MKLNVTEERENVFFQRKELKLELEHSKEATPTKAVLVEELAKKYNADPACVVVDYIFTKKGLAMSVAKAKIFSKPVKKSEVKPEEKKPKPEEEPKPKEEKKAEKKIEETPKPKKTEIKKGEKPEAQNSEKK